MLADQAPNVIAELAAFMVLNLILPHAGKPNAVALSEQITSHILARVESLARAGDAAEELLLAVRALVTKTIRAISTFDRAIFLAAAITTRSPVLHLRPCELDAAGSGMVGHA